MLTITLSMHKGKEQQSVTMTNEEEIRGDLTHDDLEVEWMDPLGEGDENDDEWVPPDEDVNDGDDACEEDDLSGLENEELSTIVDENKISKVLDDFEVSETVFRESELQGLKTKERIIMQRQDKGYYRSKTVHHTMYVRITQATQPYLTEEALNMLSHGWLTQKK